MRKYGYGTVLVLILVYFSQGFRSFGDTAIILYFKNTHGLNPTEITVLNSFLTISWSIKPVYGLISDSFSLFGYHKKSYVLASALVGLISYLLFILTTDFTISITALILGQFSQAITDVICDGYMVIKARIDPINGADDLQRYSWLSYSISSILGIILGGQAADYINPRYILSMLAFCPFLVLIASFLIEEKKSKHIFLWSLSFHSLHKHLILLWNTIKTEEILRYLLFTFLWLATSLSFTNIFTYYLYDVLLIKPSMFSYYKLASYIGLSIGIIISSNSIMKMSLNYKFAIGRIFYNLTTFFDIIILQKYYKYLGIPFYYFLFGSPVSHLIIGTAFSKMPWTVTTAKIAPKHIESSFFSLATCRNDNDCS